ncbi:putative cell surface [Erysiphe neolycopersici]|uniref:Putative cell surface n=1 Tax=Erysiphe neolycopersici TaxID=212602 RepID=A0A420HQY8_9PEZI|nr:putative cell surface [Erysiphe neolycopersici]
MSSTVNKIKDALHLSSGDRDLSKNESRTSHLGNSDSISQTERPRSHAASVPVTGKSLVTGNGTNYTPGISSNNTTQHSSNLANKLDPRVDSTSSDQYQRTPYERNSQSNVAGTPSGYLHASNEDPHKSGLLNKLDPRVDSNPTGRDICQNRGAGGACGPSACCTTNDLGTESQYQGLKSSHQQPQNLEGDLDAYGFAKKW